MDIIHFSSSAAGPFEGFNSSGASFLPLGRTKGDTQISCLHLERGGKIESPAVTFATALLVVHGRLTVTTKLPASRIDLHAGMGAMLEKAEAYTLNSKEGAIVLIVGAQEFIADQHAISTPRRIAEATWPSDAIGAAP
jgi:redox-sensitive bicupin YhaK (pirin superfamily)